MRLTGKIAAIVPLLFALVLSGCVMSATDRDLATRNEIAELAAGIRALGEGIDPEEAERAARIAYEHSRELAIQYQITDPPIIHNMKVNAGLRPRGLCWHWAEDMEARLNQENFRTLEMHRAIADPDNPFRLEHSTAIVSRRGDSMFDGIVLDPWRLGGELYWTKTLADGDYDWEPQSVVHQRKVVELGLAAAERRD